MSRLKDFAPNAEHRGMGTHGLPATALKYPERLRCAHPGRQDQTRTSCGLPAVTAWQVKFYPKSKSNAWSKPILYCAEHRAGEDWRVLDRRWDSETQDYYAVPTAERLPAVEVGLDIYRRWKQQWRDHGLKAANLWAQSSHLRRGRR